MQINILVTNLNEEHKHQQEFIWVSQLVAMQEIYINRHLHKSDELLKLPDIYINRFVHNHDWRSLAGVHWPTNCI